MVEVVLVIREIGKLNPDYSLNFNLPNVPSEGSYISIHRPDKPEPYGEDVIVRRVWWRLEHPETRVSVAGDEPPKIGRVEEIIVECEPALGPYASDAWRSSIAHGLAAGKVEKFEVARLSIRESTFKGEKS